MAALEASLPDSDWARLVASLLLVAMPGADYCFLFLVAMPFPPSSLLVPSSNALVPSSFLLLLVRHLLLVAMHLFLVASLFLAVRPGAFALGL